MLIDDIDAELDRGRIEALVSELEGRAQTFVSTSRRAIASRYSDRASVYCVDAGRAAPDLNPAEPGINTISAGPARGEAESFSDDLEQAVREMLMDE